MSKVETHGCSDRIAFAPDDLSVVTPEGAYETNTFTQIAAGSVDKAAAGSYFEGSGRRFVTLTPDGSEKFITDCSDLPCTTTIDSVSIHGGQHPVFSAEGHWLVSGGKLFHRPSGTLLQFDDTASEALFTPAGDIIVGESNGALKFYRRHESTAP